jgi:ubiquinol-cytochrome c reductase cytochrome c1 subunit
LVVLTFLLFATILGYLSYRNIWASAKRKVAPVGPLDPANIAQSEHMKDEQGIAG